MTGTGVLADHMLQAMIAANQIMATPAIIPEQIQPASIDLR
ncbi:MAG TPA: 2'-deoxycytidine 5'-triphosphate deaminase, partial [Rhodobacteraceae bacterium]|nr:2'-deoxycytidine 5'-triphosphate deaminase [Paracoccaceae bacterium]